MKSIGGTCTRESYDFGSSGGGHRGNYGAGGAVRPSPIRSVPMRGGTMKRTPYVPPLGTGEPPAAPASVVPASSSAAPAASVVPASSSAAPASKSSSSAPPVPGLKPFADPEAEFNRLDATNNTTADGEVDWDEFLAWAVEHKLDRDDDDSDDESLLQAADVKKRPSVQKASELQK